MFGKMVEGSGHVITEERPVPELHAVALAISGTLILNQGEHERLIVEGEDNILAEVKTEVESGRLTITVRDPRIRVNPTQPLVYRLTVRTLDEITLSGPGRIEAGPLQSSTLAAVGSGSGDIALAQITAQSVTIRASGSGSIAVAQLTADTLEVTITGSGSVTAAGQATRQTVSLTGSGRYNAAALASRDAQARITGSGSAMVQVETTLAVQTTGSGSVHYTGDPQVTQQRLGAGGVYKQLDAGH
jgi:hypothetical protein